jgi:hypothetical protein
VAALVILAALAPRAVNLAAAITPAPILFSRFESMDAFDRGTFNGTQVSQGTLTLAPGVTSGAWVSPLVEPGFPFTQLVPSWNAATPGQSWLQVSVQATTAAGTTDWYVLGLWAERDDGVHRTSVDGQADRDARVATDTLLARDQPLLAYRLRVTLERPTVEDPAPSLRMVGAVVSDASAFVPVGASQPSGAEAVELAVPAYSQEVHRGHYPRWGGGGEVWCSPTSTQMVIAYWGMQPSGNDLDWIEPDHTDSSVDYAARSTYDSAYGGTGNWPFNTAYAARYGLDAFVTRLRSLGEAEQFIRAGIPLVASFKSGPRELDGFLFEGGTNGHLVVIVGFDATGNPIVNDPAAWSNAAVRRVYDRTQFERVWQRGSGGIVYVIHPQEVPLPNHPADTTPNW